MGKEITNKPASVMAKLHNLSREEGVDYNYLLLRYCQERFLYRLSVSQFANNFCLKGGLFLICLDVPSTRTTKDIDFLARHISNETKGLESVVAKIASLEYEDGVKFVPNEIKSEEIVEASNYPGVRIKMPALIGKARVPIQLDFAWGDVIKPKETLIDFPTILDDEESPKLSAYSIESAVSEKFQAMVKLEAANSRMKDFYDIYILSSSNNFKAKVLISAIEATFKNRQTSLSNNLLIFRKDFSEDKNRQKQWAAFIKKHKLEGVPKKFTEIMARITNLLEPLTLSIINKAEIDGLWDSREGHWNS